MFFSLLIGVYKYNKYKIIYSLFFNRGDKQIIFFNKFAYGNEKKSRIYMQI